MCSGRVLRAGGEAREMAEVELGVLPERFGCAGASGLVHRHRFSTTASSTTPGQGADTPAQHHPRATRGPSSSEEGSHAGKSSPPDSGGAGAPATGVVTGTAAAGGGYRNR